jgi:hypothetical protein
MTKWIGCVLVGFLGLGGCSIERYDGDCDADFDHPDAVAGSGARSGHAGSASSTAGSSTSGGDGSGGVSGSGGNTVAPSACDEEGDCDPGFNCDLDAHECVASDAETCAELETEAACTNRRDCVPIYGGINCSCGQDCECKGGEAGCICESFDFFACQPTPE